jgi:hypothetical protein
MNNTNTNIQFVIPTVIVGFIAGYFFKWLATEHLLSSADMTIWLGAFGTIAAIVGAFVMGERQIHALWRNIVEIGEQCAGKKRATYLAMVTTAYNALNDLDNTYGNAYQDRMRIRILYHSDTFASMIGALAAIPIHDLESAEAAVALAGLKKNMVDAQEAIELYLVSGYPRAYKPGTDVLFPERVTSVDLRARKAFASMHYAVLEKVLTS